MADSIARHIRRLEDIKGGIEGILATAVLRGAQPIVLRAKEILIENRHFVTGTLHRSINAQLGTVTKTNATALVGTAVFYGRFVERLSDGGFLFRAAEETLAQCVAVAGRTLEEAIRLEAK